MDGWWLHLFPPECRRCPSVCLSVWPRAIASAAQQGGTRRGMTRCLGASPSRNRPIRQSPIHQGTSALMLVSTLAPPAGKSRFNPMCVLSNSNSNNISPVDVVRHGGVDSGVPNPLWSCLDCPTGKTVDGYHRLRDTRAPLSVARSGLCHVAPKKD